MIKVLCFGLSRYNLMHISRYKIGYKKGDIDINFILFIELMLRKEINGLTTKGHSVTSSLARISKF